jgi:putative protein-disulfide isomerase
MPKVVKLIYAHDPMCSWCWGFRPVFQVLIQALPEHVRVEPLLGGLATDSRAPMSADMQAYLQQTWRTIQSRIPGTRFNFDFWQNCEPKRSTWPACRAVIAARTMHYPAGEKMIFAIQKAYYLQAQNPSDRATLLALAKTLELDIATFGALLDSAETQSLLAGEMAECSRLGATSFPSLRLSIDGGILPVAVDYRDHRPMLAAITNLLET